jgi:hypothetical protein
MRSKLISASLSIFKINASLQVPFEGIKVLVNGQPQSRLLVALL